MDSSRRYKERRSRKRQSYIHKKIESNSSASVQEPPPPDNSFSQSVIVHNSVLDDSNYEVNTSASSSKLKLNNTLDELDNDNISNCNVIVNTDAMMSLFNLIGQCPACVGSVSMNHELSEKIGLVHFFNVTCNECDWSTKFSTSKEVSAELPARGRKCYEVNTMAVIAFRENGQGMSNIKSFCQNMNIPPPMSSTSFESINSDLHIAYVQTARDSITSTAENIRRISW